MMRVRRCWSGVNDGRRALIMTAEGLVFIGIVVGVGALIAAISLRAGVSLANQMAGEMSSRRPAKPEAEEWIEHSPMQKDSDNPYHAPTVTSIADETGTITSRVSFGRACGIGLVQSLAGYFVLFVALTFVHTFNARFDWWAVSIAGVFVLFFVYARIVCWMLPTTYRRGLLVAVFQLLMVAAMLSPLALLQV